MLAADQTTYQHVASSAEYASATGMTIQRHHRQFSPAHQAPWLQLAPPVSDCRNQNSRPSGGHPSAGCLHAGLRYHDVRPVTMLILGMSTT